LNQDFFIGNNMDYGLPALNWCCGTQENASSIIGPFCCNEPINLKCCGEYLCIDHPAMTTQGLGISLLSVGTCIGNSSVDTAVGFLAGGGITAGCGLAWQLTRATVQLTKCGYEAYQERVKNAAPATEVIDDEEIELTRLSNPNQYHSVTTARDN
jgi:hypothetical protein